MIKIFKRIFLRLKRYYITLFDIRELDYRFQGIKMRLNLKKDVDRRFFLNGFEKDVINYFRKIVKKNDVILDIGANIGIYSLFASKIIGEYGKVYSFEPADKAYKSFLFNIQLNDFKNIIPVKSGVSDFTGKAKLNICEDDAYNSLGGTPMFEITKQETIDLVSIDDFVLKNNLNKVDIIKVDTEGAEYLVFKGAEKTLSKFKPILFFEVNSIVSKGFTNTIDNLLDLIMSYQYNLFQIIDHKMVEVKLKDEIITSEIIAIKKYDKDSIS